MKLNQNSSALGFSLVAFLIAAGVALVLWFKAADVARAETTWYRDRAQESVLKGLHHVVSTGGDGWQAGLENLRRQYGSEVCATFTVGTNNVPVWHVSSLPEGADSGLARILKTVAEGLQTYDNGVRRLYGVEPPFEHGGHRYLVVWEKLRPSQASKFNEARVVGCVVEYGGNAAATQRLAAFLVLGLMLVSLAVIWQLVLSARRAGREAALKTKFVANYAHELKTPLSSLLLRAEMLKGGRYATDEKRARALEVIVSEGRRLNAMVLSLLDLIRIECRQMKYGRDVFDIADVARGVCETMRPFFAAHGLVLTVRARARVCADTGRVQEILENLLSNAVKYAAARGCVEVEVDGTESMTRLRVLDRGPGLTLEQIKYVFDEYWRAEEGLTREAGGSGIGLFISREHAQGMGGRLSVARREGGGCVFTLELPRVEGGAEEDGNG
ncbi:MAG: sensor histidine kinase [Kiritimatiellia bacterium]